MFDTTWQEPKLWKETELPSGPVCSQVAAERIAGVAPSQWEEHCLECTPPACYGSCALYVARRDRKCSRMVYGLYPDPRFQGPFGYGVDVTFRRWGKLETRFYPRLLSLRSLRRLERWNRWATTAARRASEWLAPLSPKMRLAGLWRAVHTALLLKWTAGCESRFDAFLLECYSFEPGPVKLLFRGQGSQETFFEHAFVVRPGYNLFELRREEMRFPQKASGSHLMLFPENNREMHLVFLWCDFVAYTPAARDKRRRLAPGAGRGGSQRPELKVKCVCWDLDGTLWTGTLLEHGAGKLALQPGVRQLLEQLDARGILQSVVSKNDHDPAWAVLEREGLQDYFLYPAINWNPKSHNLKQIAERLNIGLDSIVLVDDSAFERAEVAAASPMVRTYGAEELERLLSYAEFEVPVTATSRQRRLSYRAELQRQRVQQESGLATDEFLRSCQMVLEIELPHGEAESRRCWELCQRSNQLNLSTRRYTEAEFQQLIADHPGNCFALRCHDRFGDYGIVGFATLSEQTEAGGAELVDLVISCRVARKRVEHTFIQWVARRERARGKQWLRAHFIQTDRNGPLAEVLSGLPFKVVEKNSHSVRYEMALHGQLPLDTWLSVVDNT